MTTEDVAGPRSADDGVRSSGYAPELKRTLGPFQTFAISFAFARDERFPAHWEAGTGLSASDVSNYRSPSPP